VLCEKSHADYSCERIIRREIKINLWTFMKTIALFTRHIRSIALSFALGCVSSTLYAMPSCLSSSLPAAPGGTPSVLLDYGNKHTIEAAFWFESCPASSAYPFNAILVSDITLNLGDSFSSTQVSDPLAFRQGGVVVNGAWSYQLIGSLIGGNGQMRARVARSATQYFDPSQPVDVLNRATGAVIITIPASGAPVATFSLRATDNVTGLWWNPNESGWGLNINQQGDVAFATMFTYDVDGKGMWLVMSRGDKQSNGTTFTGDLLRTTGPAFNAAPFTPISGANVTKVGTMSIAFASFNAATLTYSVNGATVVKQIQPQTFATPSTSCTQEPALSRALLANYTDLWWNADESGWGLNLTHQGNVIFGSLFTYDVDGKGMWLVLSRGDKRADGSYSGDLFRTTGTAFNAPNFLPLTSANVVNVGTMSVKFINGEFGTLTYTYNGVTVTKQIRRQIFGTSLPSCKAG
jgi:hypothetical protein